MLRFTTLFVLVVLSPAARAEEVPEWVKPMREVHEKFTGKRGTLALFGDSITVSKAFWAPLAGKPKNLPAEIGRLHAIVAKHMREECWSQWRGAEFGNEGRQTAKWAEENIEKWLKKLNPECAVIMFGTNDLTTADVKSYDKQMRTVVEKCLANGTVVLITTLPPRSGHEEKAKAFAEAVSKIAADFKLPLIDYHSEILKRRPDDWDGTLAKFKTDNKDVYQVPTLISGDGVHPSNPARFNDYSADALKSNGYQLRTVLTLHVYAEVITHVLSVKPK